MEFRISDSHVVKNCFVTIKHLFPLVHLVGETDELVGTPPKPEVDIPTNIIHVFVENIIDPGQPFATTVCCTIFFVFFFFFFFCSF